MVLQVNNLEKVILFTISVQVTLYIGKQRDFLKIINLYREPVLSPFD